MASQKLRAAPGLSQPPVAACRGQPSASEMQNTPHTVKKKQREHLPRGGIGGAALLDEEEGQAEGEHQQPDEGVGEPRAARGRPPRGAPGPTTRPRAAARSAPS